MTRITTWSMANWQRSLPLIRLMSPLKPKAATYDCPQIVPLNMDYAYTTTAHSAQGLTCDRVLYKAESFSRTTAQDTYYVSISRERHEVVVLTDDSEKLPEREDQLPYKGLAHDLQPMVSKDLTSGLSELDPPALR